MTVKPTVTAIVNALHAVLAAVSDHVNGAELLRVVTGAVLAGKTWPQVLTAVAADLPHIVGPAKADAAEAALHPLHALACAGPDAPAEVA